MKKQTGKNCHRWRVSSRLEIPKGRAKDIHETFTKYSKARRVYKHSLIALYRQQNNLTNWKICLNRIEDDPWANPKYSECKGKE